jgi:Bifunctional DNA primase/polymerase, N-terminal
MDAQMSSHFHDAECRDILMAAIALAAAGLAVFPCVYCKKEPATRRGFYDATTNPVTIRRWFGGNFKRNLAVRTGRASGAWVLDVDNPESLKALEDHHGSLPVTRQSQSSRGLHFWFKTTGVPIASSNSRVAPGLDVKAEGGYVVVPSSVHPDGVVYQWVNDEPLQNAPEWLIALASKPPPQAPPTSPRPFSGAPGAYGAAALRSEIDALAATPPGARNNQLNKASFCLHQLVAGGELDAGEVEQRLLEAAIANGLVADAKDGLRSVVLTIRSGARAGLLHPRSRHGGGA